MGKFIFRIVTMERLNQSPKEEKDQRHVNNLKIFTGFFHGIFRQNGEVKLNKKKLEKKGVIYKHGRGNNRQNGS